MTTPSDRLMALIDRLQNDQAAARAHDDGRHASAPTYFAPICKECRA